MSTILQWTLAAQTQQREETFYIYVTSGNHVSKLKQEKSETMCKQHIDVKPYRQLEGESWLSSSVPYQPLRCNQPNFPREMWHAVESLCQCYIAHT